MAKFDDVGIVKNLFEQGKIQAYTLSVIQDEALCETFKWTPDELYSIDLEIVDNFTAVLTGRQKGEAEKMKKPK